MVVCTMTKKQLIRIGSIAVAAAAAILIIIFAVSNSVTASADSGKKPIYRVERGDNRAALTFNCAYDASGIDEILETLNTLGAKATFFVTGEFCDGHSDAVRKMSTAGHSVQNGSDKNGHIAGMNVNDLIADTNEAAKKIKGITGIEPEFYRAPYGDYDEKSLTTLEGMGYTVVQWSVDSDDLEDPGADSVRHRVLDNTVSGSVLLFHNDAAVTPEALPQIVTELKRRGFELVKLEDLVFTSNCFIDEKGTQIYQPAVSAALPIVYSDENAYLDSAFEKIRQNLSLQQIYDLSSVGRVALVDEIKGFLDSDEQYALREASYEELMDCYMVLVFAAEHYGAGGAYTRPEYEDIPQIVPPAPEYEDSVPAPEDVTLEEQYKK